MAGGRARGRRGAGEDADTGADVDADADRRIRVTFMVVGAVRDERRVGSCGLDVILRVRSNKSVENSWEMGIDYYIWTDEVPLNEWLRHNFRFYYRYITRLVNCFSFLNRKVKETLVSNPSSYKCARNCYE